MTYTASSGSVNLRQAGFTEGGGYEFSPSKTKQERKALCLWLKTNTEGDAERLSVFLLLRAERKTLRKRWA